MRVTAAVLKEAIISRQFLHLPHSFPFCHFNLSDFIVLGSISLSFAH
jgi:hypothetical protein